MKAADRPRADAPSRTQTIFGKVLYSGIQGYWLIKNSDEVSEVVSEVNQRGQVSSIKTYDFSTLCTNLPHKELKERIPRLIKESFEGLGKKYISIDRHYNAIWTENKRRSWLLLSCEDVEAMLHFLLDNVFIQVGGNTQTPH